MTKKKSVDIINNDKIVGLAYKYAFYRDFYSWIRINYPTIHKKFVDVEKENNELIKKVRKNG